MAGKVVLSGGSQRGRQGWQWHACFLQLKAHQPACSFCMLRGRSLLSLLWLGVCKQHARLHNAHCALLISLCAWLVLHPCILVAEQVVWALPQQQLLDTLQSSPQGISIAAAAGAAAATAPSMQLLSPSFVLPCAAVGSGSSSSSPGKVAGAAQHVKTEW